MKRIIIGALISMLVLSSFMGAFTSATAQKESIDTEPIGRDYTHNVFGEYFTATTCVPCKYTHSALKILYNNNAHPFYYITYVYNKNNVSKMRKTELQIVGVPTTCWDGDYDRITGGSGSNETEMEKINESILLCGARDVKDIDISLNVEWQGAVNPYPPDDATQIPIEAVCNWTITEMKIDVAVTNNEASDYNAHLHVIVTEVNSSLWNDKFDKPYTFEFKNYAHNDNIVIGAGDTWDNGSIYWDGLDYTDMGGNQWDPHNFDYLTEENTAVIAAIFDKDNDDFLDETAGFRVGDETDPKKFCVYFGDTYPPELVVDNSSVMKFNPYGSGNLNWSTKYYWRVDVWNDKDELTPGTDWEFTTRGNAPPFEPRSPNPKNESTTAPIDTNLKWLGNDPDGDDVTYDVYFGVYNITNPDPPLVKNNHTKSEYDPTPTGTLEFNKKYVWKIVAWDEYGERTEGPVWWFKTEQNKPPNKAEDPKPPDGSTNVPVDSKLRWNGSDPNSGDTLRYDVYFGPNPNPPLVKENLIKGEYDPYDSNPMELYQEYFWSITTRDKSGLQTPGDEWSFKTGENEPPTAPDIDGPSQGKPEILYNFTFNSTDPLEQRIEYIVDWDDGNEDKTELHESGEEVTLSHSWTKKGTYVITATAVDEYGAKNESTHEILIPRSRSAGYSINILSWLYERFPYMFQLIRYILGL